MLIELDCETDFVAKNDEFQQLADAWPTSSPRPRPADVDAAARHDPRRATVKRSLDAANATLGEKIELRRFVRFAADTAAGGDGGHVTAYLHKTMPRPAAGGRRAGRTRRRAAPTVAEDVAHADRRAMRPRYVSRDEIPAETLATERRIAEATAREEGKPEQALPKIIEGRVNGFFKEVVLTEQASVLDSKKTVGAVLAEAGVTRPPRSRGPGRTGLRPPRH